MQRKFSWSIIVRKKKERSLKVQNKHHTEKWGEKTGQKVKEDIVVTTTIDWSGVKQNRKNPNRIACYDEQHTEQVSFSCFAVESSASRSLLFPPKTTTTKQKE